MDGLLESIMFAPMAWRVLCALLLCRAAEGKLTVHLVPHTHDDLGWLKTVDEYFTGANNSIQEAAVRNILNAVTGALLLNPDRKFTYVEQGFFQRWWRELSAGQRTQVKRLVSSGQLHFANGGWCMHDEAATHYVDMVDQTTLGHRFLLEEFGVVPTVGWQIDPFGHSATQAALLSAEAGFDSLFFGRIDYQDLKIRKFEKAAEFIWRSSPSLGDDAQVFASLTGEYGGNYGAPSDFDYHDKDTEPVESNKGLSTYNAPSRVEAFVKDALVQALETRGDNIMWTMGSDFRYEEAEHWMTNMDHLIEAVNADGRIAARYSTPNEYVAAKRAETNVTWPLKTAPQGDDFFPYADGAHKFWTGYFTSRPALKGYIRQMSALHNAVRQVQALAGTTDFSAVGAVPQLAKLEEAMGVAQHHDAASGTAKQHVTFDYEKQIAVGGIQADGVLSAGLAVLTGQGGWNRCARLNETVCDETQQNNAASVLVWNQLAQARHEYITFPVYSKNVSIKAASGTSVPVQVYKAPETITNYNRSTREAAFVATFRAKLPPVGFAAFTVTQDTQASASLPIVPFVEEEASADYPPGKDVVIENDLMSLTFAGATGRLSRMQNKKTGTDIDVEQYFCYYVGNTGESPSYQSSGAYIFRPDSTGECYPIGLQKTKMTVIRGDQVQEVRQTFARRKETYTKHSGYITAGADLMAANMTLKEAEDKCTELDECMGFTYEGSRILQKSLMIFFKSKWDISPSKKMDPWTSYKKEDDNAIGKPWLTQTIRLGAGERFAQFEFTVGEIPKGSLQPSNDVGAQECVAWRSTGKCLDNGLREPANDQNCSALIPSGTSGYCECADGYKAKSDCKHEAFRCFDVCFSRTGKEIVSRFNTSIASAAEVLTDSNGRDMLLRKRDFRPSWDFTQTEPVAGNYYPINSAVAIKDSTAQLTVLVDRAEGAGSVADGVLELMVHRRLLNDDGRGVGEPLDETESISEWGDHTGPGLVIRGTHYVVLEPPKTAASTWRPLADRIFAKPLSVFKSVEASDSSTDFSALANPLPPNVQLMTLQALSEGQLLLRLSHQFGINEDAMLSNVAAVNLATLLNPSLVTVSAAREMSLTNNQEKSRILAQRKMNTQWPTSKHAPQPHPWRQAVFDFKKNTTVTLGPLEIKTFVLTVTSPIISI